MNRVKISILFCISLATVIVAEQMTITHAQKQKVGIRLAYIGCAAQQCTGIIASDLGVSGQFSVQEFEYTQAPKHKREVTDLVQQGIYFLLILESHKKDLQYRLYDTTTGQMVSSGRCVVVEHKESVCAHHIAGKVWYLLTGQKDMFNSRIAYAKEVSYKKNIMVKHICVAQHDGREECVMVSTPTISIAPRWGGTLDAPLIFYSEYTNTNVRLMMVDVDNNKRRKVVTRYDGVTMHLTSNHNGSMHAFSSSRGDGNSQIYLVRNGELEQCTHDDATNTCPVFNHDGSLIYYCSDVKTGVPHIMVYDCIKKTREPIPALGYCFAPAYNNTRKLLTYSKMVDGIMQIFVYDPATHKERQITFDFGNHEDPTWSPCGNFLAYTHELYPMSRIRVHCYTTGYEYYITPADIRCTYPAWSLY